MSTSPEDGEYDVTQAEGEPWVAEDAIEALKMERSVRPTETNTMTADRIFEENLPQAAMSIVHMALHSASEKIRLDAAKYVTERVVGKPDTASQLRASAESVQAKWESLVAESIMDSSVPNN